MNEKNSKWKVFVVAFVLVFAGFAAMMVTPTVLAQEPTVTTEPAEDITSHTAVLNMSFDMDGAEEVTVWFAGNETGEELNNTVGEATYGPGNTTHQAEVEGLVPDTTYDFEAYLEYNETTKDGGILSFTTETVTTEPTVTTQEAVVLDSERANITMDYELNDAAEATVWFAYNETGEELDIEVGETDVTEDGDHTYTLEGLEPWTEYNFTAIIAYVNETGELEEADQAEERTFLTGAGVEIDGPTTAAIDTNVTYEALVDGDVASYSWTIMEGEDEAANGTGENITHSFGYIGENTVMVEIEDVNGVNETAEMTVDTFYDFHLTLLDNETDEPIEGARVILEYGSTQIENYTDSDGLIPYEELYTDQFVLSITTDEYKAEYDIQYSNFVDNITDGTLVDTIYLDKKDDFIVKIGPVVHVDEKTGDEFGLNDAEVNLTSDATEEVYQTVTDDDGLATLTIPENPFNRSFTFNITHEEIYYEGVLVEENEYGRIEYTSLLHIGAVVDNETDEPVEGVELLIQIGDSQYEGETNSQGIYTFDLPEYTLLSELSFGVTYSMYEYGDVAETYDGSLTGIVRLEPKDEFAVFIGPIVEEYDDDYQGLQDVEVTIDHDDIEPLTNTTDFDGEHVFYVDIDPREETFELEASLEGYNDVTKTFTGTESGRIVMTEEEPEYYEVTIGPVKDQDGKMVSGAEVTLYDEDGLSLGSENTDDFGEATFDEITIDPEGTEFEYMITKNGYEDAEGTFTGESSGDIEMTRVEDQEPQPAEFSVTDLNVDPTSGEAPLEITITANIENVGDEEGTIRLFVGGEEVNSWTLGGGDTATVDETYEIEEGGTYNVELGGERETVEVEGEGEDEVEGLSTAMLAGIGLIVIIIIIIIAVMMMKKGGEGPMEEEEFGEEEELFEEEEFGEEEFGEEEELFEEEEEFGEEEELFEEEEEFGEEEELFEEEEEFGEEEEFDEGLEEEEELFDEEEF
ncbi:MAG: hypothetical protein ACOC89_04035, partial [Candidatus Saliniplasma sp.]